MFVMLKDKNAILACLGENFQDKRIQKETIIYTNNPQNEFKNKYMIKVLHYLSDKFQVLFTCGYFATSPGKGVVGG